MTRAIFASLLAVDDKASGLQQAAREIETGGTNSAAWSIDQRQLGSIPGSPFAYWTPDTIRELFRTLPPFEQANRFARVGLQTGDDFRFVRLWWETHPSRVMTGSLGTSPEAFHKQTCRGRPWALYAKGGRSQRFYSDVPVVVNWADDGRDIREFVDARSGKLLSRPQNTDFYFRPGLTWTLRAPEFAPVPMPAGCIFSVNGYAAFADECDLEYIHAIFSSSLFDSLFKTMLGRYGFPQFVVGVLNKLPFPDQNGSDFAGLLEPLRRCIDVQLREASGDESTHVFCLPNLCRQHAHTTVGEMCELLRRENERQIESTATAQVALDEAACAAYGIGVEDMFALRQQERVLAQHDDITDAADGAADETDSSLPGDEAMDGVDAGRQVKGLLSYALGCAFGRWDVRYATGEKTPPELPDPFAPLPVCSPGMLQGEDGLPLSATPTGYPLRINWNGILVDEPHHADDVVGRVREVLHLLLPDTPDSIETEMCAALGVKDLRDYFRKPGSGGFWMDHVHMYSKSHRKAPIYWLLQSSHKNYGIWLYYQRLDSDLLFKVLQNYVEPKLKLEQNHETEASHRLTAGGLSVSETRQAQKDLEKQQDLVAEIREFRDTLKKAADLRLTPDLDDGVVLNIAPLHDLVPWSEAAKYWDELQTGKYPWSSIGKQLECAR